MLSASLNFQSLKSFLPLSFLKIVFIIKQRNEQEKANLLALLSCLVELKLDFLGENFQQKSSNVELRSMPCKLCIA